MRLDIFGLLFTLFVSWLAPAGWALSPIKPGENYSPRFDLATHGELEVAYRSQKRAVELAGEKWTITQVRSHSVALKSGQQKLQLQLRSSDKVGDVVRLLAVTQLQVTGRLRLSDPATWLVIDRHQKQNTVEVLVGKVVACQTYSQQSSRWFLLSDLTFRTTDALKGDPKRWIMRYGEHGPVKAYEIRVEEVEVPGTCQQRNAGKFSLNTLSVLMSR